MWLSASKTGKASVRDGTIWRLLSAGDGIGRET
jgi:hypothetical protein